MMSKNFLKLDEIGEWWDKKNTTRDMNAHLLTYQKYQEWRSYIRDPNNRKRERKAGEGL